MPAHIRCLVLDVDGVLTDGSIFLDDRGIETKRFNVKDGLGIVTWLGLGFEVAVITRRSGEVVKHRCRELGITRIVQGSANKGDALRQLAEETGIPLSDMAYIGDDWPDLPAMRLVGLPIAVADAAPEVRAAAALVTDRPGGRGAVREAIEHLLRAKHLMEQVIAFHTNAPA